MADGADTGVRLVEKIQKSRPKRSIHGAHVAKTLSVDWQSDAVQLAYAIGVTDPCAHRHQGTGTVDDGVIDVVKELSAQPGGIIDLSSVDRSFGNRVGRPLWSR